MAKPPPSLGPIVVTKGRMETGDQFFARREAERGTARLTIDEALAASRDALDVDLTFIGLEADRAFVLKERDDNPDGTKPLSLEAWATCARLMNIGNAARAEAARRAQAETEARAAARLKRVKKETAARVEKRTIERQKKAATAKATATKKLNVKARHQLIRKLCDDADVPIETPKIADWLAERTGVCASTIKSDLRTLRAELSFLPEK